MKNNKSGSQKALERRERAEKEIAISGELFQEMSETDIREILRELQLNQVELEFKNEELLEAQEALEKSHQSYASLFDFAPVGYFTCDESGKILNANLTIAEQLGVQRTQLIGKLFSDYIHMEDKETFSLCLKKIFKRKERQTCPIRLISHVNKDFYGILECTLVESLDGKTISLTSIINISQLKLAKEELRKSAGALELLRDIAFMINETHNIKEATTFCLKRISQHSGWCFGHAFIWDESTKELAVIDSWYASTPKNLKQFKELTRDLRLKRRQGLAGSVLNSGKAEWTDNPNKDITFRRLNIVDRFGINTAAAFPIIVDKKVVGVLEFFSNNGVIPDARILKYMASVGMVLGRFVERVQTEKKLVEQQRFVQSIADSTPDILYVNDLMKKKYVFVNKQLKRTLGHSRKDIQDLEFEKIEPLIHPKDIKVIPRHIKKIVQASDNELIETEFRFKNKEGEWRWIHIRSKVFQRNDDGSVKQYIGLAQDVTEQKRDKEALSKTNEELRKLTTHLDSVREEERKKISQEIHDQLGQALTAIQMDVSWLINHLPEDQEHLHNKTQSIINLIQKTSQAVRDISMKLRSSMLDDLGIVEALKWEVKEFQLRTGIECKATFKIEKLSLAPELATDIFRVFQEVFTNIARHSKATKVDVILDKEPNQIMLKVKDNGKGILESEVWNSKSLGIIGMTERMRRWSGKLNINSIPNSGTRVEMIVPLKNKIEVLIADDHQIVREGLKQVLSEISDIKVVDEASDGYEVLSKVWKNKYDVLILDLSMPGRSGLEILEQLKTEKPDLPVLILSVHPEELYAVRALKAGASGYLGKVSVPSELATAIRKVAAGKKYITSNMAEQIALEMSVEVEKPLHEKLSNREYQVMEMIASGNTVKEIADSLSLSVSTVHTCRTRMLNKLGMKNDPEVIHYAIKHGIVK